jgi:hypothetical protein
MSNAGHEPPALIADVAALFVDARGSYPKLFLHCWDEKRDATTYDLDLPVIAHPPCQRWCRLAGLVEARWGHKRGEDGGLFASALATLRRVGGVLEHPAYSDAWARYGLPRPPTGGGWVPGANPYEWTCYVEQWRYGHQAKKATWLYYVGSSSPPALLFGAVTDASCVTTKLVSWCGNRVRSGEKRERLGHKAAIATPPAFREALLVLARHAVQE